MADHPFMLAVKAAMERKMSAKEYLMKVENKTAEEVAQIIEEHAATIPTPPAPPED